MSICEREVCGGIFIEKLGGGIPVIVAGKAKVEMQVVVSLGIQ